MCRWRPLAAVVIAAVPMLAGVLGSPARAAEVRSGSLTATVGDGDWRLGFEGSAALRESVSRSPAFPGVLGFHDVLGWHHATRVRATRTEGQALLLEVATDDPAGRLLDVRVEPVAEGALRVRAEVREPGGVDAVGIGFAAPEGERQLGFGERSNAVDQRGGVVDNVVAEGPYQPEERPFMAPFVPPPAFRPTDDAATYYPIPWLLSSRGFGVLVEDPEPSSHHLGTDAAGEWSVQVQASRMTLLVVGGPTPREALRRYTAYVGRQPAPTAAWMYGPWFDPGGDSAADRAAEMQRVKDLRAAGAAMSVAITGLHYLPCGDDIGRSDAERQRNARFHDLGMTNLAYMLPLVCRSYAAAYDEGVRRGVFLRDATGSPYTYSYTGVYLGAPQPRPVVQVDFTHPDAEAYYHALLRRAVDDGYDGWMEDFGEYTPTDGRSYDGTPGPAMHNLHPLQYHRSAYRFTEAAGRPLARFVRSGWTGSARYSPIVWSGDPTADWGYDGLRSAVTNALTMGLSGVSFWGSDIGGFFELGTRALTPELLVRWIELGAVSPLMETKARGLAVPSKARPQVWDPEISPHWARWSRLHTQLQPYLAAATAEYQATGMPVMRHHVLSDPGDEALARRDDQFLLGPDILVAPVLQPGARSRRLRLPAGRWVDLWRSASWRGRKGGIQLTRARVLGGGQDVTVLAPLGELPLLVRYGTVLMLGAREIDTLADTGAGMVRRRDRADVLELLAWPGPAHVSRFGGRGERLRSTTRPGRWILDIRALTRKTLRVQASLAGLRGSGGRRALKPCAISVGGRRLSRRLWSYDRRANVLRARVRVRPRQRVAVSDRC